MPVVASRGDDDPGSRRRVRQGVVDQDAHDLGHAHGIAQSLDPPGQAELQVRVVLGQRGLEFARHRPRELAEIDLLGPQLQRARLEL